MPKLNVFVACPYMLFPLEDYKRVFEAVGRAYPVVFRFADEQITNQHVLAKIANYIREADFCLFDITGWNPNVALELGIAVGLNRKYFITFNPVWDNKNDAPSDLKGIDRLQYRSNSELEAKLVFLMKQEMPRDVPNESAFDNLKARIVGVLEEKPSLRLQEIVEIVTEEKILVQSVVRAMAASGELVTGGAKKGTRYSLPTAF